MNRGIVLTRSRIDAVFSERRKSVVRLGPAYIETLDDPGAAGATTGFKRDVILELYDPGPHAVLNRLPATVTTAVLTIDEQQHVDRLPLPLVTGGTTQLRLETDADEVLNIRARGIAVIFYGRRDFSAGAADT